MSNFRSGWVRDQHIQCETLWSIAEPPDRHHQVRIEPAGEPGVLHYFLFAVFMEAIFWIARSRRPAARFS